MPKLQLHWQILIAIVLAVFVGYLSNPDTTIIGIHLLSVFDFIGTMFMNALKMVIVPLIAASIITGIAGIGGSSGLGRMGGKTILYYMTTSLFAILVGLAVVNLIEPGIVDGEPIRDIIKVSDEQIEKAQSKVEGKEGGSIADIFLRMVPPNIVTAAAEGQMLGLIFFCILFGFFITKIPEAYAEAQYNFWQGAYEVMLKITDFIIMFAPIGIFGLIASVVIDLDSAEDMERMGTALASFSFTVILALGIHMFLTMPLMLKFLARVNPLRHYKAMAPAMLTSFSTASSSATLPITLECVEKNAGVSKRTSSFVLPLGATINMDGTALYECVVAIFIFQAFGYDLTFTQQFLIVFTALMTSIGVAGIPAASLIAIMIILKAVGLDDASASAGLAMVLVVDRVLDMCRTSVNVFSDSCGAVIIGKSEGEEGILTGEEPAKA
ncbi:Proton/glutamate symporter @ Sodium/glutamate symporter [hydrothermal vent metagenome]|uniref:Proton/glutamate symporter @ Sodium/glutamate symporter n=1 Tax=hydrothermal vent metagenome TaxID=652676 RepID=A0A3B0ZL74_9ZZZZ